MDEETEAQAGQAEDNDLIRSLRADIKEAKKAVKDAEENARSKVVRENLAKSLMPSGFKGLADIFESEVEGELTPEAAAEWLKARGITASPDEAVVDEPETAALVEEVTNLGSAVASAANLDPNSGFDKKLADASEGLKGAGDLPQLTKRLESMFDQ